MSKNSDPSLSKSFKEQAGVTAACVLLAGAALAGCSNDSGTESGITNESDINLSTPNFSHELHALSSEGKSMTAQKVIPEITIERAGRQPQQLDQLFVIPGITSKQVFGSYVYEAKFKTDSDGTYIDFERKYIPEDNANVRVLTDFGTNPDTSALTEEVALSIDYDPLSTQLAERLVIANPDNGDAQVTVVSK